MLGSYHHSRSRLWCRTTRRSCFRSPHWIHSRVSICALLFFTNLLILDRKSPYFTFVLHFFKSTLTFRGPTKDIPTWFFLFGEQIQRVMILKFHRQVEAIKSDLMFVGLNWWNGTQPQRSHYNPELSNISVMRWLLKLAIQTQIWYRSFWLHYFHRIQIRSPDRFWESSQ